MSYRKKDQSKEEKKAVSCCMSQIHLILIHLHFVRTMNIDSNVYKNTTEAKNM